MVPERPRRQGEIVSELSVSGVRRRGCASGWLPRMADLLEQLDLLLLIVAGRRGASRPGVSFDGQRYLDLMLAGYVGEHVTIRYDLCEIRVA